jgi:CRP-like cAMP-binding protein
MKNIKIAEKKEESETPFVFQSTIPTKNIKRKQSVLPHVKKEFRAVLNMANPEPCAERFPSRTILELRELCPKLYAINKYLNNAPIKEIKNPKVKPQLIEQMINTVLKISQKGKYNVQELPKINGFEPSTWLRISKHNTPGKNNETDSDKGTQISSSKPSKMLNTEQTISRIMYSLNHKHPSEAKKMFQDLDKRSRKGRIIPSIPEVIEILTTSKEKRTLLQLQRIDDYLRTVPVFESKPDYIIAQLCKELVAESFDEGGRLFRQGEIGNKFYFILCGTIKLTIIKAPYTVNDKDAPQSYLAVMKAGEKFGDQALINDLPRSTFAYANEKNTVVLTLEKEPYLRLMGVAHAVEIRSKIAFLKKFEFTAHLDMQGLRMIADKLFTRGLPPNTVIVEENKIVESVFFIQSGKIAIYREIFITDELR